MAATISIDEIKKQDRRVIAKELTFKPKFNFFNKNNNQAVRLFRSEEDTLYIPFNYYLDNFAKYPNENVDHKVVDFDFIVPLLERQESVVKEAIAILEKERSVILQLRPGFGKTATAIYLSSLSGYLTLVLHDRVALEEQWFKSYGVYSNAKVYIVGGKEVDDYDVIICSNKKYKKIPQEVRSRIGCIIFDECHKFCTEGNRDLLLSFTPKYIIALSATVERSNGMEQIIYSICGANNKVIRKNEVKHNIFKVETNFEPKTNNETAIWNSIIKQQMNSDERNEIVYRLVSKLASSKICILTSEVLHSQIIFDKLSETHEVAIMSGKRKTYSDSRILVGTVSKIGTGFDEEMCCPDFKGVRIQTLILVSSNKSHSIIEQVLGRSFRSDNPEIYSLVDDHKICRDHWKELMKWSKANCGIVKECSLE